MQMQCKQLMSSTEVSEELWELRAQNNVEIVSSDMPRLYAHDASPVEKYVRKILFATFELERDLISSRTSDALAERRPQHAAELLLEPKR